MTNYINCQIMGSGLEILKIKKIINKIKKIK